MYRLLLFGGGRLEGPEGPHTGNAAQGHRLALLVLLAVEHPRPLSREKLIAYLWPENDTEGGRRLLRQYLFLLRGTLGKDALFSDGDELRLNPARLGCDLWAFREALERGDPAAAVAAYGGPFLEGVFLRGADEFERWVEAGRTRLALRCCEALEALAEQCEAAGDVLAAAGWWRRLVEHDPYNARFALRLMQALETAGDRAGALRHADAHAALLQAEFGAVPEPDLQALAVRLRDQPAQRAEEAAAGAQMPPPGAQFETEEPQVRAGASESASDGAEASPITVAPVGEHRPTSERSPGAGPATLPRLRLRHLGVGSLLVLGLLGTLLPNEQGQRALAIFGFGAGESLLSRGVLAERERILLADFASPMGDSLLARMATVAFRVDVAQSPVLTLVEPRQVNAALVRMQRSDARILDLDLAREVAVREGIKAVLTGEIARSGSGYLLSAQLLAAESGEVLAAHRETARDSTTLLPALDRLSKQIRRRIGESLRSVSTSPPLAQVTTSSLDALQKFSQAQEVFRREGDNPRVVALLEEAVALDTTFAMAYRTLGMTLRRLGEQPSRRAEALTSAYQYRHRLPDRERYHLAGTYYTYVTWELEKAITTYRTLLDSYPEDAQALNNLGVVYSMTGNYERAEELTRRALEADSGSAIRTSSLIAWQFNQGKLEEAESTFARFAARFSGNSAVTYRAVFLASARGDYAAAASRAHAERQVGREDLTMQLFMARSLADLASLHGRLREAEHYTREVDQFIERQGDAATHLVEALHLAHLEITLGLPRARSLDRVERALAKHPLEGMSAYDCPYPDLAAFYARAGQPARARTFLAEWQKETPLELQRIQTIQRVRPLWGKALPWVLGEIALAEGRPWEAVEHFRLANHGRCLICALPNLGRAYEAARQPDSAIVAYERFLGTHFMNRLWYDAEWRGPILERLGQLHEARGDRDRAAEHYTEFIELWRDADPELQPRVREARRRLAALGGE
jgi:DNA-binding SARP family transcriptional activator/Tfp pilus assembly protein PilF